MGVYLSRNVSMPKIDEAAKAWELKLAERVGKAVQKRRKALEMTGVELAERTAELGYPITRVAISKIEGNSRAGKLDVAELLVLAEALKIAPVLLLAANFPDGEVETGPGHSVESRDAVGWFSGQGTELVQADAVTVEADRRLSRMREMLAAPNTTRKFRDQLISDIESLEREVPRLRANVQREKEELWGEASVGVKGDLR